MASAEFQALTGLGAARIALRESGWFHDDPHESLGEPLPPPRLDIKVRRSSTRLMVSPKPRADLDAGRERRDA